MKRSQGPAASPARSCPHHSLAVGAHQLFDWQEQERSLQEFIIPGYSRTVHFTKPQTGQDTRKEKVERQSSSRPWVLSL